MLFHGFKLIRLLINRSFECFVLLVKTSVFCLEGVGALLSVGKGLVVLCIIEVHLLDVFD